ncbi:MAG: class I SAM-dependent methyltransferase [Kiritimatiellia bacterium]
MNDKKFSFGRNWQSFLRTVGEPRIEMAIASLREILYVDHLAGRRFLDIGSGSGLFSLAARRLGADVTSFDADPLCVACGKELRRRYSPDDGVWRIVQGSILDEVFVSSLGQFDVVYAWGVLHHTGKLWQAMANALSLVQEGGIFCVAIYNDAGWKSRFWRIVKRGFCSGLLTRSVVCAIFLPYFCGKACLVYGIKGENVFAEYYRKRGMSIFHDWIDWLGGFPYEVASVEEVVQFCAKRGFFLFNLKTVKGIGNNQYVFVRSAYLADRLSKNSGGLKEAEAKSEK